MANIKKARVDRKVTQSFTVRTGGIKVFKELCESLNTNPSHEVDKFISEFNRKHFKG